jgi:hypothetical protein
MPIFVHLTPEKNVKAILRSGISLRTARGAFPGKRKGRFPRGIFAVPVTGDFFISHQWLRELKRGGQRTIWGIYFRIPDDEPVEVGHFGSEHVPMTAAEAAGVILNAKDARGYEVILSRPIGAKEIHRARRLPQVLGWRYRPDSHRLDQCMCVACNPPGTIKSRRKGEKWEQRNIAPPQRQKQPMKLNYHEMFLEVSAKLDQDYYQQLLDWGRPRRGHPEGTVRAHIAELESNLKRFGKRLSDEQTWKLKLLIHTHDTFKAEAKPGVSLSNRGHHANLARQFLISFGADDDLLAMVQYHDEPFALWQQYSRKGRYTSTRLQTMLDKIRDWDTFTAFLIIDGCTEGKSRQPLEWFFGEIADKIGSRFTIDDID